MTHTPGPWLVNAERIFGNGHKIATVNDASPNWQEDRDIIAAAPDMIKALLTVMAGAEADGWPPGWGAVQDAVTCALAKAEGR